MPDRNTELPTLGAHGASRLPSVEVDSYNVELRDDDGFLGDRASKGAFRDILEQHRKPLRKLGADPFGDEPTDELGKRKLDAALTGDDPEAAGLLQGAIEDFAGELALVIRRFLKVKAWRDTERIAMGGGFRGSRVGELAIGRASILLKSDGINVDLQPIHNHPDEAGLIGCAHLMPQWMLAAQDGILAVDIGGTNIRAGIVELNLDAAEDLSKAAVWKFELWRHGDEEQVDREGAVARLVEMLQTLISQAGKARMKLAPVIGIGCPGLIEEDGSIDRGAQNLPGNWASSRFHLPSALHDAIPTIGKHDSAVIMHNDAVVQGLSEVPYMQDVERWAVLTIGTGLGNARYTNRKRTSAKSPAKNGRKDKG